LTSISNPAFRAGVIAGLEKEAGFMQDIRRKARTAVFAGKMMAVGAGLGHAIPEHHEAIGKALHQVAPVVRQGAQGIRNLIRGG